MRKHTVLGLVALGMSWVLSGSSSYGLPGQSVDETKTWMQGHPTLRAESREGLRVHRAEVPSRRFTFQASVLPIGGLQPANDSGFSLNQRPNTNIIRREEFIVVDYDEPVTLERLEEALRVVYGPEVYADYRRSELLDGYRVTTANSAQGNVRLGSLYAYWLEITLDTNGVATIGKLNVVLPEDVARLQGYLERQRAATR
ncbi:MAG: hypothetical protein AAF821_02715 [Cyanobacteria bacterium P01_D01_bin.156]